MGLFGKRKPPKSEDEDIYREAREYLRDNAEPDQDQEEIVDEVKDKLFEYVVYKAMSENIKKEDNRDWIVCVYCSICTLVILGAVIAGLMSGGLG